MTNNNVILRGGWVPNPYNVVLRPGTIPPPPVVIPAISGFVSYLFLFPSRGQAVSDPVISKYYNPVSAINVGCCPDTLVYDLVTGSIDPRWGLFITLGTSIIPELFNHPNLELLVNSPKSLAHQSFVIENKLARAATFYQFMVSGIGTFPLNLTLPN